MSVPPTYPRAWQIVDEMRQNIILMLEYKSICHILGERTVYDLHSLCDKAHELLSKQWNEIDLLVKGEKDGE